MLKNHQMYLFELTPFSNTHSSYNFKKKYSKLNSQAFTQLLNKSSFFHFSWLRLLTHTQLILIFYLDPLPSKGIYAMVYTFPR